MPRDDGDVRHGGVLCGALVVALCGTEWHWHGAARPLSSGRGGGCYTTMYSPIKVTTLFFDTMAGAVTALRASKPPVFEDTGEEESLFDTLVTKLPSQDTWDAEFSLGVLVLG